MPKRGTAAALSRRVAIRLSLPAADRLHRAAQRLGVRSRPLIRRRAISPDRWGRHGATLAVACTIRDDFAHIIMARHATRAETRRYMNEKEIIRDAAIEDDFLPDYGHLEGWQRGRHSFPKLVGTVTLDSDVFDVFRTSEEVNTALRILIHEGRVPHLAR